MSKTETGVNNTFSFRHLSIQKRLPLLICILLLSIIVVFSWTSYFGVRKAALGMAKQRLQTLTGQISNMLGQSAQTVLITTKIAANNGTFTKYLATEGKMADSSALQILEKLRLDSTWIIAELLNTKYETVLQSGLPGVSVPGDTRRIVQSLSIGPDSCKIGNLFQVKDSIFYAIIAAVTENKQLKGYLVRWRYQRSTAKAVEQLSQLLDNNAALYVGNKDGSFWTDMNKKVDPPPKDLDLSSDGFSRYARPKTGRVLGSVLSIPFTDWRVLIEVSENRIFEAANRFLNWIVLIGGVLVIIGIVAAWLMSRKITQPLNRLTTATSAIAEGDYNALVKTNRQDEIGKLARAFNDMVVQVKASRQNLEKKVEERTIQLQKANKELEAFSYSVSHDLRAPLRAISGYAVILKEDYSSRLDDEANRITDKIVSNAKMMGQLIDDLISFSQMGRKEILHQPVDMKKLAETCVAELLSYDKDSKVQVHISPLPPCHGDASLLKQVWVNLIGNALKYSSKRPVPCIEIGCTEGPTMHTYFVRDNGVGFDMQYSHKLFGVFQRLHSQLEFEGTGVGLALGKRIIDQHNGKIWAESALNEGAVFYFSLPVVKSPVLEMNV